jgi:hypothetical protein
VGIRNPGNKFLVGRGYRHTAPIPAARQTNLITYISLYSDGCDFQMHIFHISIYCVKNLHAESNVMLERNSYHKLDPEQNLLSA